MHRDVYTCSEDDVPTHRTQVPVRVFMVLIPKLPCSYIRLYPYPICIWVGVNTGYVVERHAGDPTRRGHPRI